MQSSDSESVRRRKNTNRIIIVDYDMSTLRVFKRIFLSRGFRVDTAKDGEEAKQKMKTNTYDAALVSFVLPDMDGIDLLLFTTKSMPEAAKIITTGYPSLKNGIKAFEADADAYFSKPVKPEELLLVVEEKLRLARTGSRGFNPAGSSHKTSEVSKGKRDLLNGAC